MAPTSVFAPALGFASLLVLSTFSTAYAATSAPAPARLAAAAAGFGVNDVNGYLTIDNGAGLVIKLRKAGGDITSLRYKGGPELQARTKYSHLISGIGASTSYTVSGGVAKITLSTASLTHYMLVRQNDNNIYMATHITSQPSIGELRWITRLNADVLNKVPTESYIRTSVGPIESGDIFGMANGHSRSKYYGNERAMELGIRGVSGTGVGVYMVYGNRESSSGGPFFRDIQNQSGDHTELYNYMNSGHAQTEKPRLGLHGPYALMFTDGAAPAVAPDMSWMGSHGLRGWIGAAGRGKVVVVGLAGRDPAYQYTVGFSNPSAQYWVRPVLANGGFGSYNMKAGSYRMTVYKGELEVHSETVQVPAGGYTALHTRTIEDDPATAPAVWRIGKWDGTPLEFRNGTSFSMRHPSDPRNVKWGPVSHAVGTASNNFPAAQWKEVNNGTRVTFMLTADQIRNRTVRIGITTAFAGGRPVIQMNNWTSAIPEVSVQARSRSLTLGTYRGNNHRYSYAVPASAFVVGINTMTINVVSGSSGVLFLSPGFAYDALDML